MKLGFWNRLAIVATGLALLIAPVWYWSELSRSLNASRQGLYELCMKDANIDLDAARYDEYSAKARKCLDERHPLNDPLEPGWSDWWDGVVATAFVSLIIYLLIWGISATVRWVWRGRKVV